MASVLLVVHVVLALGLVFLVLIQHGKGADAGAAFGSGASGTVFGARGAASFLTRATGALAAFFFANSLALAYLAGTQGPQEGLMERVQQTQLQQDAPEGAVAPSTDVPSLPAEPAPADSETADSAPAEDVPKIQE